MGRGRPTDEKRLRQAHEMVLHEVENEIEWRERRIALLNKQKKVLEDQLRIAQMEADFTWMVEN